MCTAVYDSDSPIMCTALALNHTAVQQAIGLHTSLVVHSSSVLGAFTNTCRQCSLPYSSRAASTLVKEEGVGGQVTLICKLYAYTIWYMHVCMEYSVMVENPLAFHCVINTFKLIPLLTPTAGNNDISIFRFIPPVVPSNIVHI